MCLSISTFMDFKLNIHIIIIIIIIIIINNITFIECANVAKAKVKPSL